MSIGFLLLVLFVIARNDAILFAKLTRASSSVVAWLLAMTLRIFKNIKIFYNIIPPETSIRCAFTQRASSVHKKATTPPISSGKPTLPKAVADAIC